MKTHDSCWWLQVSLKVVPKEAKTTGKAQKWKHSISRSAEVKLTSLQLTHKYPWYVCNNTKMSKEISWRAGQTSQIKGKKRTMRKTNGEMNQIYIMLLLDANNQTKSQMKAAQLMSFKRFRSGYINKIPHVGFFFHLTNSVCESTYITKCSLHSP